MRVPQFGGAATGCVWNGYNDRRAKEYQSSPNNGAGRIRSRKPRRSRGMRHLKGSMRCHLGREALRDMPVGVLSIYRAPRPKTIKDRFSSTANNIPEDALQATRQQIRLEYNYRIAANSGCRPGRLEKVCRSKVRRSTRNPHQNHQLIFHLSEKIRNRNKYDCDH